jgi:hypothetical protein
MHVRLAHLLEWRLVLCMAQEREDKGQGFATTCLGNANTVPAEINSTSMAKVNAAMRGGCTYHRA